MEVYAFQLQLILQCHQFTLLGTAQKGCPQFVDIESTAVLLESQSVSAWNCGERLLTSQRDPALHDTLLL